ncbi:MAG: alpha/beta hydrolase [Maritimibacter sp.]
MRRFLKWLGIAALLILIALAVVPFLIPVRPLEGLVSADQLAGPGDRFITLPFEGTDGLDIHYVEVGDPTARHAVILLHGSVFNASTWDQTMDVFARYGRVIAYDQLPYGLSEKVKIGDWTGATPYTTPAAVDRLFELMDALDIDSATLVGNSYGAVLAVLAADAHPERIDALVLSDPAVYVSENVPPWLANLPQVAHLGPLLARLVGGSESFIHSTWADPEALDSERMAKTLIHTRIENWDQAFWAYLKTWQTPDLAPAIAAIGQPTLILFGAEDSVIPVAQSERLTGEIAGSDLVVLPSCGHVPQEECPGPFGDAVSQWLDGRLGGLAN